MIKTLKGKLLLALGITLVLEVVLTVVILSTSSYTCGICNISAGPCPPCQTELGNWPWIFYSSVPLFIVIFLILHLISRYKK